MRAFRHRVVAFLPVVVILISAPSAVEAQRPPATGSCLGFVFNPAKDFVQNFNNPCFALPFNTSSGGSNESGDPDADYDDVYYQVIPGYSLIVLGQFPNARFMSATVNDDHLAVTSRLFDYQILPLSPGMVNPFEIGALFQPGSTYGLTVSFGGQLGAVAQGCETSDTTIDQNFLDASQIHSGLTWLGYPNLPPGFPVHETGANAAGSIIIRRYVDISNYPPAVVIVRQLSNGCAINANEAISLNIVSVTQSVTSSWLHQSQIKAHQQFAYTIEPKLCYKKDPQNSLGFFRSSDYIPIDNGGSTVEADVPASSVASLVSGNTFMRVRFVLPTIPDIPCTTGQCTLTGNEDLRYMSIAFLGVHTTTGDVTLGAIDDASFVTDPNGNVTLIVGVGATPPPNATAANGYTYYNLGAAPGYANLSRLDLRNFLPNAAFYCSGANIPFFTMEYNGQGGFMGAYVPTVDFPTASQIPATPAPPVRTDSCTVPPAAPPVDCNAG